MGNLVTVLKFIWSNPSEYPRDLWPIQRALCPQSLQVMQFLRRFISEAALFSQWRIHWERKCIMSRCPWGRWPKWSMPLPLKRLQGRHSRSGRRQPLFESFEAFSTIFQLNSVLPISMISNCAFPLYVVSIMEPESISRNEISAFRFACIRLGHLKHAQKRKQKSFVFVTLSQRVTQITHRPSSPSDKLLSAGSGLDPEADHRAEAISSKRFGNLGQFLTWRKCQATDTKKRSLQMAYGSEASVGIPWCWLWVLNHFDVYNTTLCFNSMWSLAHGAWWMVGVFPYMAEMVRNVRTLLKQLNWLAWGKQRSADES